MKSNRYFFLLILALLGLISCTKEVTQEELIREAVEIKLQQWKVAEVRRCSEEAYTKAEAYVDSLLVAISLETKLDTIPKPAKPEKPEKPVFKIKPDSVIVDPLIHDPG